MAEDKVLVAQARFSFDNRIIVDYCPYCRNKHVHLPPVGRGRREAPCLRGEYILDFSVQENEQDEEQRE